MNDLPFQQDMIEKNFVIKREDKWQITNLGKHAILETAKFHPGSSLHITILAMI
jgi:hypothetical protein